LNQLSLFFLALRSISAIFDIFYSTGPSTLLLDELLAFLGFYLRVLALRIAKVLVTPSSEDGS